MTKIETVCKAVRDEFEVSADELLGRSRVPHLADARAVAMVLALEVTGEKWGSIADYFDRDKSLLVSAKRKVSDLSSVYPAFARKLAAIREELKGME